MAVVNIPRDVKDEFYRYKMPAIVAKVEGRGNGIKTVIVNMADVSKSLERPPAYPTKFFGFELGAITTIEQDKDKYIVNGKHDQSKLASVLDDFIEKFVLCKKCQRNPETYVVIKGGLISLKCKACGGSSPVDMRHKLCTFILKNPPPAADGKKLKEKEKEKLRNAENGEKDRDGEGNGKEEEKPKKSRKKKDVEDDDDVVWHTDASKEAAEQRRKDMLENTSEHAAKLLADTAAEKQQNDPLASMQAFLSVGSPSKAQIVAQLHRERDEHKLDDEKTARILFLALFDANVFKQVKTDKLEVLKHAASSNAPAAADYQVGFLLGLTELAKEAGVLKVVPHVLKYLYDSDLLEEEAIMTWYNAKPTLDSDAKVKEAAKVFVDWLKTADEESEEDGDEDDGGEE